MLFLIGIPPGTNPGFDLTQGQCLNLRDLRSHATVAAGLGIPTALSNSTISLVMHSNYTYTVVCCQIIWQDPLLVHARLWVQLQTLLDATHVHSSQQTA